MRATGLGTPATRAAIIETLYKREYVVRTGKVLEATDKGIALVDVVHPDVKSPAMTGEWEAKLKRVKRGEYGLGAFMEGIERYVSDVVEKVKGASSPQTSGPRPARLPQTSGRPAQLPQTSGRPAQLPQTSPPRPPSPSEDIVPTPRSMARERGRSRERASEPPSPSRCEERSRPGRAARERGVGG